MPHLTSLMGVDVAAEASQMSRGTFLPVRHFRHSLLTQIKRRLQRLLPSAQIYML